MVAERISGQSWTEFTRARLTDKLRMTVTFTVEDLTTAADAAVPYAMDGDTRLRTKLWPIRITAAGGINTSIASFANWLRLHLDKGEFEGQRLLSPTLIQQLQTPRVHVAPPEFAEYGDTHYGLGFRSHSYRGTRVGVAPAPSTANPAHQGCSAAAGEEHAPALLTRRVGGLLCLHLLERGRQSFIVDDCTELHRLDLVEHPETERRSVELNREPLPG